MHGGDVTCSDCGASYRQNLMASLILKEKKIYYKMANYTLYFQSSEIVLED